MVTMDIKSQKYRVLSINQDLKTFRIEALGILGPNDACPKPSASVTLDLAFISYTSKDDNYTMLFECGPLPSPLNSIPFISFTYVKDSGGLEGGYLVSTKNVANFENLGCKNNLTIPAFKDALNYTIGGKVYVKVVLALGYEVEVKRSGVDGDRCDGCVKSDGRCGYNHTTNSSMCFCLKGRHDGVCVEEQSHPTAGTLRDGRSVVAKKINEHHRRRVDQFKNEVEILTDLLHPNLVSLYGCTALNRHELLLVYEYIPNGTVAEHIRGSRVDPGLSWPSRMCIAVETASALKYLHTAEVIHQDVKTTNILFNQHLHVKLADFGLSRLFRHDVSHVSIGPKGTMGYVDPEYTQFYRLTSKSDVFSFGVVLIELIPSLRAFDCNREEFLLADIAINKIQNKALHELVDQSLGFDSDSKINQMIRGVAELAFRCLQKSRSLRPSMDEVLSTLQHLQNDGNKPEVMDMSSSNDDEIVQLNDDPSPSTFSIAIS